MLERDRVISLFCKNGATTDRVVVACCLNLIGDMF